MHYTVSLIFFWRSPAQIFQSVVRWIPVQMSALHAQRTWADERFEHETMNVYFSILAINYWLHLQVTCTGTNCF